MYTLSLSVLPTSIWALPKNKRLRTAHIGVGGMGAADLNDIASHKSVDVTALCDVDSKALFKASKLYPNAKVYKDLKEALSDIDYSVAFTARRRDMNKEIVSNEKLIDEIILKPKNQKIGIVFGGEASGLTNEHISLVSKCVTINTDDNFIILEPNSVHNV